MKTRKKQEGAVPGEINILIVEDDLLTQNIYKILLEQVGVQHFDIVSNAQSVLEKPLDQYHLIMSDYELADEMNGIELAKHIHLSMPEMPIVIVSSHADETHFIELCKRSGITEVINKPLDHDILRRCLLEHAHGTDILSKHKHHTLIEQNQSMNIIFNNQTKL